MFNIVVIDDYELSNAEFSLGIGDVFLLLFRHLRTEMKYRNVNNQPIHNDIVQRCSVVVLIYILIDAPPKDRSNEFCKPIRSFQFASVPLAYAFIYRMVSHAVSCLQHSNQSSIVTISQCKCSKIKPYNFNSDGTA